MKLGVVGVGDAGSRIVNRILAVEKAFGRNLCNGNALLITSTKPAFETTERVPEERRLTIGDVQWEVDNTTIEGNPDVGRDVAIEEQNEIIRAFDRIEFQELDGVLVVAGLAGGTGGGAGAVVLDQLQTICDDPVYAVAVLPEESEGRRPALNAARSLQSFVERADNVIAFDNEAWRANDATVPGSRTTDEDDDPADDSSGEDPHHAADPGSYARVNAALAERLVTLFAAGEFGDDSAADHQMDPSDIMRTLDTGGLSSIGYASTDVEQLGGILPWIRAVRERLPWTADDEEAGDEATDAATINALVRRAARSKLTLPCNVQSADRALILLSGPPRTLSRKGFESGRYWLESEADVVDVMAGDEPHEGSGTLTAVVLFANVTDVPRIEAMQETALGGAASRSTDEKRPGTASPP